MLSPAAVEKQLILWVGLRHRKQTWPPLFSYSAAALVESSSLFDVNVLLRYGVGGKLVEACCEAKGQIRPFYMAVVQVARNASWNPTSPRSRSTNFYPVARRYLSSSSKLDKILKGGLIKNTCYCGNCGYVDNFREEGSGSDNGSYYRGGGGGSVGGSDRDGGGSD